ncbi:MAG: NUDIX domain-containing protein [Candidatus Saccharimonadales bacterium]
MEPSTEQYEVLDDQGHKTGQILDRATVHKQELWHEVVNVWVINPRGEILMQLRAPDVELSPNVWDVTIGTHLQPNEAPIDAALRAIKTGLGLDFPAEELEHLFNVQGGNPMPNGVTHNVFGHVFLINKAVDLTDLRFDSTKITRFAWIPLSELMVGIGSTETKDQYFPRSNNYYPQLFEAFQAWM